ncbi:uncharacterized protein LOC126667950 [Mercurialis annua]|uniref:uncharacterized protein LOC126667950 n=1 Tax=Mercurialis annua TaxID=3986 RepID=UPI00215E3652|nr:uncharacterized protein LOC126667950 [Mercurialis annua]
MKGASKVIMGATLVMVVSLAIVLGLVLVLLAELYCTLLLRRRRLRVTSSDPTTTTVIPASPLTNISSPETLQSQNNLGSPRSYYAPGVLQAPRSLFFPAVSQKENKSLDVHTQEESNTSSCPIREIAIQISSSDANNERKSCIGHAESLVYISNPVYDNDANRVSRVETPFETPDSSPSRLERGRSSSSSCSESIPAVTPPLSPMKKLPAEACSVSLRDVRSLGTSGSDSVSNNGVSSSSSSGSPCTSPSW